jgi:hypothetical protein
MIATAFFFQPDRLLLLHVMSEKSKTNEPKNALSVDHKNPIA